MSDDEVSDRRPETETVKLSPQVVLAGMGVFLLAYGVFVVMTDATSFHDHPAHSENMFAFLRFAIAFGWCLLAFVIYWKTEPERDLESRLSYARISWMIAIAASFIAFGCGYELFDYDSNVSGEVLTIVGVGMLGIALLTIVISAIGSLVIMISCMPGGRVYKKPFLVTGAVLIPLAVAAGIYLELNAWVGSVLSYWLITGFLCMTLFRFVFSVGFLLFFLQVAVDMLVLWPIAEPIRGPIM